MTRPDAAHAETGWLIPQSINLPHLNTTGTITTAFDSKNCTNLDEIRAGSIIPVSISENQRGELVESTITRTLNTAGGKPGQGYQAARIGNAIRRLTPLECERLQAWPDNHTLHRADGTTQSDATRYHQIGNGITANVARWICDRINIAENHTPQQ